MNQSRIIMNYTTAPSQDDLMTLAQDILETMPDDILEYCEDLTIGIEEMADESIEDEFDLDDPFELLALFRNGQEISPGVMSKVANDDDVLVIFRRPILDLWCETGEHLSIVLREAMIMELGRHFDFSDSELEEMSREHYQGML